MSDQSDFPSQIAGLLNDLARWLDQNRIAYAMIGGVAVSLLAGARTTQDFDAVLWTGLQSISRSERSRSRKR